MDERVTTFLTGFIGFGRSFNRSVLAHDQELHAAYRRAHEEGYVPCNRLRILTIGDKGVGKSSTLQQLQGRACDPSEDPRATEGVEITVCETSEGDPSWTSRGDGVCRSADDPEVFAAWSLCSEVDSLAGIAHHRKDAAPGPTLVPSSIEQLKRTPAKRAVWAGQFLGLLRKIWASFVHEIIMAVPAILVFFAVCNYFDNFGCLCWVGIFLAHQSFFKSDFNSAYRFVTPITFQILMTEAAARFSDYLGNNSGENPAVSAQWLLVAIGGYLLCFIVGFLCGVGCRTGMAVAFCFMAPQSEFHLRINIAAMTLAIGNLFGPLLVRFAIKPIVEIANSPRQMPIAFLAAVGFVALADVIPPLAEVCQFLHMYHLLLGCVMGFGHCFAVLKGREIVALKKLMLPYAIKKSFGFVIALGLGHSIGWRLMFFSKTISWISIILSVLSAFGFVFYDWKVAERVKRLEEENIPITTIRRFLMHSATKDNPTSLKLHLWDNAGDNVYQTMQQLFRPAEAVYLLTFSLKAASARSIKWQLGRLRKWLFTVMAQSKNPNTIVFIIGTHRNSVEKNFIVDLAQQIENELYDDFCSILAFNGDVGPLYVVENQTPLDEDGLRLRQSVIIEPKKAPFMKELFSIPHLKTLRKLQNLQSEGTLSWITTVSDLLREADTTLENLRTILVNLHRTGDVIYRHDDKILEDYVVLDPQSLVDVLKNIVRIPPKSHRHLSEATSWQNLERKGIASLDLIKAVVGSKTLLPCLRLMEAYSLLIPVYSTSSPVSSHPQEADNRETLPDHCIVPSHLPDFAGEDTDFWVASEEDEEYFFDFGYVAPVYIFYCLLARCWSERDGPDSVFKTRGRFRHNKTDLYSLQLQARTDDQNTVNVIIQHNSNTNRCNLQVLQHLYNLVKDIRRLYFVNLPFACGPVCRSRSCSPGEAPLTVLEICGHDKEFPTVNQPPQTYMGNGKYHEVRLNPKLEVTCGRRKRSSTSYSEDNSVSNDAIPVHIRDVPMTASDGGSAIAQVINSTFYFQRATATATASRSESESSA